MQKENSMKTPSAFVLFPIPADALRDAGICAADLIAYGACDGAVIIERVDEECGDHLCDRICERCAFHDLDCDEDCEHCPCRFACDDCEVR